VARVLAFKEWFDARVGAEPPGPDDPPIVDPGTPPLDEGGFASLGGTAMVGLLVGVGVLALAMASRR
jgi:hypothetical protein